MNGRWILVTLLAIILIVAAVGLGVYVYNVGVAQGLAQSGKLSAPETGTLPYPYYGPFFFRPFGFGFGFLGFLFPLFFIFLIFALLRGIFLGGHWGRHRRYWREDGEVPPQFEEWHRKAHEAK
ncbi:MAG: hypothetical protein M1570_18475 [Chloroflexi bacterium]|nr:hypothetical protein [Chloroflexota bacterium]